MKALLKSKAVQTAAFAVLLGCVGVATWCCGPKLSAPELVPTCPGEKFEICEPGDGALIGPHNCYCP